MKSLRTITRPAPGSPSTPGNDEARGSPVSDAEISRRAKEISALWSAAQAVLKYRDFQDAARAIFASCRDLIGARAGYVALLEDNLENNEVVFLEPGSYSCSVDDTLPMPIRGMRAEAYRTGDAVYHNDFAHSDFTALLPTGHATLDNVLFAPLLVDGKAVGLLGLANKDGGFDDDDARVAATFGELAAIALSNSWTFESLEHREEQFRAAVDNATDSIVSVDATGTVVAWNQKSEELFGYPAAHMVGRPLAEIMPERFRDRHHHGMTRALTPDHAGLIGQTVEFAGLRRDGSEFPLELSLARWQTKEGVFFTGIMRDITRRQEADAQLKRSEAEYRRLYQEMKAQAQHDPLTGLCNHRRIMEVLSHEIERGRRGSGLFSVVMLDVNHFKPINDTYGHVVGDDVLIRIATTLTSNLRRIDTAGRYGGDEFLLVLPYTNGDQAHHLAATLLRKLQVEGLDVEGVGTIPIHLSAGVSTYPLDGREAQDLLRKADHNMYETRHESMRSLDSNMKHLRFASAGSRECQELLEGLLVAINSKDYFSREHAEMVTQFAAALGRAVELEARVLDELGFACLFHDVGMIGVPDHVLRKPGPLAPREYQLMQQHAHIGVTILQSTGVELPDALNAIMHHHERFDGSGYPSGLRGNDIPELARIIAVADAYSAMMAHRPYRNALGLEYAIDYLRAHAGTLFDPELVPIFLALIEPTS